MNTHEAECMRLQIATFDQLTNYRSKLQSVLSSLQDQSGFTGNTRESRRVLSIGIGFSATRGGAQPTTDAFDFPEYVVEASDLGNFLIEKVRSRIKEITDQIDAL